jgi:hypothetical protein
MARSILRVSSNASSRGVEASAKSRPEAAVVTSSRVRRLMRVEIRMRNGSRSRCAISVTDAALAPATAARIAVMARSSVRGAMRPPGMRPARRVVVSIR